MWQVREGGQSTTYKLCSRHFAEKVGDVEFETVERWPGKRKGV
jgi:hypothetical protein